jgi:hypothetical protein
MVWRLDQLWQWLKYCGTRHERTPRPTIIDLGQPKTGDYKSEMVTSVRLSPILHLIVRTIAPPPTGTGRNTTDLRPWFVPWSSERSAPKRAVRMTGNVIASLLGAILSNLIGCTSQICTARRACVASQLETLGMVVSGDETPSGWQPRVDQYITYRTLG